MVGTVTLMGTGTIVDMRMEVGTHMVSTVMHTSTHMVGTSTIADMHMGTGKGAGMRMEAGTGMQRLGSRPFQTHWPTRKHFFGPLWRLSSIRAAARPVFCWLVARDMGITMGMGMGMSMDGVMGQMSFESIANCASTLELGC